jgi:Na+/melibiose symporter-like transporter
VLTERSDERATLSSVRMFFAVIVGGTLVSVCVRPLVALAPSEASGFFYTAAGFALTSSVLLLVSFFTTEERVRTLPERYRLRDALRLIRGNDALLRLSLATFFNGAAWMMGTTVALYYFKYVLGAADFYPVFFLWMLPANLAAVLLGPFLSRRLGKHRLYLGAALLVAVALGLRQFTGNLPVFVALSLLASFAQMTCSISQWSLLPDTVENAEHAVGIRSEGVPYAFFALCLKVAIALGGAFAAWLLDQTGYVANAVQTGRALLGIELLFNAIPAGLCLACALCLVRYPLTGARFERISAELAERRRGVHSDSSAPMS